MDTGSAEQRILTVYRDTIDVLYAYAARHSGGDRTLAEDVTQETWLRAVREWRRSGPPENPLAWLITVAHNLLASYYRRRRPDQLDADTAAALRASENGGSADVRTIVDDALARLPAGQADLIEAFHLEDRKVAHIAEGRGISERAVEGRLRRARQRLRRELEVLLGQGGTK
jgi:RNA polymerase sigma-70 factor (ECF subfamily)